jgi:hypothetical protein
MFSIAKAWVDDGKWNERPNTLSNDSYDIKGPSPASGSAEGS